MKTLFPSLALLLLTWLISPQASAQTPGPSPGFSASMTKFFGEIDAFSATAEMRILEQGKETMSTPVEYALLDGQVRMEMDLTKMKSAEMPPQAATQVEQMGLSPTVTIIKPATKSILLIYPRLQAYAEVAVPPEEAEAMAQDFKVETHRVGEETIQGQKCVKNRLVVTDPKGQRSEAFTWNSPALKNFPIQTEVSDKGMTIRMRYRDVKLAKPDRKLFEAPANFKKYDSVQALTQAAALRMFGQ